MIAMFLVSSYIILFKVLLCLAEFNSHQYQLVTDVYLNMSKIISTYVIPTHMECVLTCLLLDTCRVVSYDSNSSKCTLGNAIVVTELARNETPQLMHILGYPLCYQIPDFQLYELGSATTCAWTNENDTKNYTDAAADCKARGGHLYTIKSTDKLSYPMTYGKNYWIGLNDMAVENVFRWADDGSVLANELRVQIFMSGQPNNYLDQDCCLLDGQYRQLNDQRCNLAFPYICEISNFS